jgi:hypothetical protein
MDFYESFVRIKSVSIARINSNCKIYEFLFIYFFLDVQ